MNSPIAQLVALTCHGNAFLQGHEIPIFFPNNSTSQFCDYIHYIEFKKNLFGKVKEITIADSPNAWFLALRKEGAIGIRMNRKAVNNPQISDRMSAGFVGGGGEWSMEVTTSKKESEHWIARWNVWNQDAPQRRIWRTDYGLACRLPESKPRHRNIEVVWREFRESLLNIHEFSRTYTQDGFTECFAKALVAIDDPEADIGYHKDLYLPEQLSAKACSMIKAAMSSWVYGGMGSWNDMGFDGDAQKEYDRVSTLHFTLLNEAIETAASSSHKEKQVEQDG